MRKAFPIVAVEFAIILFLFLVPGVSVVSADDQEVCFNNCADQYISCKDACSGRTAPCKVQCSSTRTACDQRCYLPPDWQPSKECLLDSDCGPGYTCDAYWGCIETTTEEPGEETPSEECFTSKECPPGSVCGVDGKCSEQPPKLECYEDSQCPESLRCIDGTCSEQPTQPTAAEIEEMSRQITILKETTPSLTEVSEFRGRVSAIQTAILEADSGTNPSEIVKKLEDAGVNIENVRMGGETVEKDILVLVSRLEEQAKKDEVKADIIERDLEVQYKEILSRDPNNFWANWDLATLYKAQGKYEESLKTFDAAADAAVKFFDEDIRGELKKQAAAELGLKWVPTRTSLVVDTMATEAEQWNGGLIGGVDFPKFQQVGQDLKQFITKVWFIIDPDSYKASDLIEKIVAD